MSRKITTEELVDAEIERLKKTEAVKLAQKEKRLLYRNGVCCCWMVFRIPEIWERFCGLPMR